MLAEPIAVVASLARTFDGLGIRYLVGGSLASSIYGIPRATQDVDLVADMMTSDAERLAQFLAVEFYVDIDMIREAVQRRRPFNLIHLETMFKADIFTMGDDAWSREEMIRARTEELSGPHGPQVVRFASPEDTLLHKLVWYRLGDEVSDRQWSDILGVITIQGDALDLMYLDHWAAHLDVADLLARAKRETSRS